MVVYGWWQQTDRGVCEPRVAAVVRPPGGRPRRFEFLVDSGPDRTFMPCQCAEELGVALAGLPLVGDAFGVGSAFLPYHDCPVTLCFHADEDTLELATTIGVFRDADVLDSPAMGRDVLDLFAVVLDPSRRVVAMLEPGHPYAIGPFREGTDS